MEGGMGKKRERRERTMGQRKEDLKEKDKEAGDGGTANIEGRKEWEGKERKGRGKERRCDEMRTRGEEEMVIGIENEILRGPEDAKRGGKERRGEEWSGEERSGEERRGEEKRGMSYHTRKQVPSIPRHIRIVQ